MLDQIVLLGDRFVVVGDLNAPGVATGQLDPHVVDVFSQYGLRQHVTGPTHASGNTLDLILSRDEQINQQLVINVAVQSVCFSDHHLLACHLSAAAATSHDDVHLPVAPQDRQGSLLSRHSAVQAVW